jgi:diacylglycerol O-acyltransferase / wax synthase
VPIPFLAPEKALAIAIMSYNGRVEIGLLGDYDAMPDLERLGRRLEDEIEALLDVASEPVAAPDGKREN